VSSAPKVSVIVPIFNAEASLEASLRSLMSQTLDSLEILVVDDASTDNSPHIVDRLAKESSQIKRVSLQSNQGVHEARLAGIRKAGAPWIGFLDADDYARKDMFETMYRKAIECSADIVVCGSYRVNENRKPLAPKIRFRRDQTITDEPFKRFCAFEFGTGMLWNKLYRKEVIQPTTSLHFPWRQNINEDLVLNIGCFHNAGTVCLMKDVLHEYTFNQASVTSSMQKARAFVDTYRAFAIAIKLYAGLGDNALHAIVDMYRKQLAWGAYQIGGASEIAEFQSELNEATELIYRTYPLALGLLASRPEPPPAPAKQAVAQLARKCLSLLRV
jgi:glycosyltransferase involved in cell wall biosynthesis